MRRAVVALLLALPAAGCATTGSGSAPPAPTSAAPAPGSAVPAPAPTGGTLTVDGVIERGVEPGCLVLRAGAKSYLLQGAQASAAPLAVPVRVSGELELNVASYCQQGTPLHVTTVTRR